MRHADFDVQLLIEELDCSCDTINEVVGKMWEGMTEEDLTPDDHNQIDNSIFHCSGCSWWSDVSQQGDNGECLDCNDEDNDKDEEEDEE